MPKLHTPITDQEAEEWVERMLRDAEEVDKLLNPEEWEEFLRGKLQIERGQVMSPYQLDVLGRGRSWLGQGMAQAGFVTTTSMVRGVEQTRIRDMVTGRYTSWGNVQKEIVPFRPPRGTISGY